MLQLVGRTAIITGASRGIGIYIARALAQQRMNLVLAARSEADLEKVAVEMRALGARVLAVRCDVANAADRAELIRRAEAEFGEIDVLVNNAGIEITFPYDKQAPEEIEQVIAVNLTAPMLLTRAVLPGMVARKRGHIVNIASLAGKVGVPYGLPYASTKAGLIHFTESLRSEFRGTGVSGSVVCPGFVSEVGMYDDMTKVADVKASRLVGTSTPTKVAAAVVKCIKRDRPEAIVNPGPMRLASAFAELAPGTFEKVFPIFGANALFKKLAKENEARAAR
jgi:short-subunit dehydrogenase